MKLKCRLECLEQSLPPPPAADDLLRQRRWDEVLLRWEKLYFAGEPLLVRDEAVRVKQAVRQLAYEITGPLAAWLRHLRAAWCRLPELPRVVMKGLLVGWLSPEADGGVVCNRCGLECPRHREPPVHT